MSLEILLVEFWTKILDERITGSTHEEIFEVKRKENFQLIHELYFDEVSDVMTWEILNTFSEIFYEKCLVEFAEECLLRLRQYFLALFGLFLVPLHWSLSYHVPDMRFIRFLLYKNLVASIPEALKEFDKQIGSHLWKKNAKQFLKRM